MLLKFDHLFLKHSSYLYFIADNDIYVYFTILGEALDIIKSTLCDKNIQNEAEIPHENIHVHQLNIRNFKKIIPGTKRDYVETTKDYNRTYMTIKALYNFKTEYKDN